MINLTHAANYFYQFMINLPHAAGLVNFTS